MGPSTGLVSASRPNHRGSRKSVAGTKLHIPCNSPWLASISGRNVSVVCPSPSERKSFLEPKSTVERFGASWGTRTDFSCTFPAIRVAARSLVFSLPELKGRLKKVIEIPKRVRGSARSRIWGKKEVRLLTVRRPTRMGTRTGHQSNGLGETGSSTE